MYKISYISLGSDATLDQTYRSQSTNVQNSPTNPIAYMKKQWNTLVSISTSLITKVSSLDLKLTML